MSKKLPQQFRRSLFLDAAIHIGPMVAGRLRKKARAMVHAAALGVGRAVINPAQPRKRNGRRAHRARFQRDIQIEPAKPFIAEPRCGLADDEDFGMGRRIMKFYGAVAVARQDASRLRVRQYGADGHFAAVARGFGLFQGFVHKTCESGHGGPRSNIAVHSARA